MAVISPALRLRRPAPRVRRDPIDISLVDLEAEPEFAPTQGPGALLAALEARRAATQAHTPAPAPAPERCVADPHDVWVTDASAPVPVVVSAAPAPRLVVGAPGSGVAADQVRAWLAQVDDDLRKVRARVEYLRTEQARLDEQQRLMAQLLTMSTPL